MYLWEDEASNERYDVDIHEVVPLTRYLFRRLKIAKIRSMYELSNISSKKEILKLLTLQHTL